MIWRLSGKNLRRKNEDGQICHLDCHFLPPRHTMHGITALTKETGAPHLLNILFSFCWRACPEPLHFVFLNLACSLHSGTPLQNTASFTPVFPTGLGGPFATHKASLLQKFQGPTFALTPGWTHPSSEPLPAGQGSAQELLLLHEAAGKQQKMLRQPQSAAILPSAWAFQKQW